MQNRVTATAKCLLAGVQRLVRGGLSRFTSSPYTCEDMTPGAPRHAQKLVADPRSADGCPRREPCPMSEPTDFEREYILQTRREIDTEKQERDHILNFAVVVLGAIAFAIAQNNDAEDFLRDPGSLYLEASGLVVLTAMFWVRWKKLRQIADRWFVLDRMMVRHFGPSVAAELLESVVVRDLTGRRYLVKDVVLNAALSLPIYALIAQHAGAAAHAGDEWRAAMAAAVIAVHAGFSLLLLMRRARNPLPRPEVEDAVEAPRTELGREFGRRKTNQRG